MGLNNVDNCPMCGRIFVKAFRDVCPNCLRDIEKMYEKCKEFLRKNRGATIHEVSDATEVPIRQITKFVREGRISLVDAPNMSYPCEVCGTLIRDGNLCDVCRGRLAKDYNNLNEDEKKREEAEKRLKQANTYKIKE